VRLSCLAVAAGVVALVPWLAAQTQTVNVQAGIPPAVGSTSANYTGAPGNASVFYCVVVRYPSGYVVPQNCATAGRTVGISGLGGGNSVRVNWSPGASGATGYDVIRLPQAGFSGSCSGCAVALNISALTYVDASPAAGANYPPGGLVQAKGATGQGFIDNVSFSSPALDFLLNGVLYRWGLLPLSIPPGHCIASAAAPPFLADAGSCGGGVGTINFHGTPTPGAVVTDFDPTHIQTPNAATQLDAAGNLTAGGNSSAVGGIFSGVGSPTPSAYHFTDAGQAHDTVYNAPTVGYNGACVMPAVAPLINQVLTATTGGASTCVLGWESPGGGGGVPTSTVAGLPGSPADGATYAVTDSAYPGDCTVGGGSGGSIPITLCSWTNSAWLAQPGNIIISDGGTGGGVASELLLTPGVSCSAPALGLVQCNLSPTFDVIGTGTNIRATMTCGGNGPPFGNCKVTYTNHGVVDANEVNHATVTGTSGHLVAFGASNSLVDGGAPAGGITQLHSISATIDGGGTAISTGAVGVFPSALFACTINTAQVSADQTGSITVDVWKTNAAIPTSANKISASAPVTLSSAQLNQASPLTGWTTAVASGDVFGFSVASAATVQRVTIQLWCQ
jgi:hypothetical protein